MKNKSELDAIIMFSMIVLFLIIGEIIWDSITCSNKGDLMLKKTSYGLSTGCMIEYRPGEWVPINQYRVVD